MRYLKNKFSWSAILIFVLSISRLTVFAQGDLPGDGCDPFAGPSDPNYCAPDDAPIDTWIFLLVFLVLACTAWYYYKQQKSLRTL